MISRCAANLLLLASLLAQSSTSLSAERRHNKRRIRSTPHKEVTAENYHVLQPHNFPDNKDTANSVPHPSARIVGGMETQPNRYPYMVSLQKVFARQTAGGTTLVFFAQKCGGTLIAEDIVLTAAHCVDCADRDDPDSCYDRIILGRHDLRSYDEMKFVEQAGVFVGKSDGGANNTTTSTNSAGNATGLFPDREDIGSLKFGRSEVTTYLHPLYSKNHRTGAQYDFALIKLPTRAYNETATGGSLSPIELNFDPTVPTNGQPLTIAGWGATRSSSDNTDSSSSSVSPVLLEATVPYLTNEICRRVEGIVGSTFYSYKDIVNPCMMCAMSIGPDACSGDSGGPLLVRGAAEDGSADIQVGIVSFGVECGNPNFPGVYARISEAFDWISETVCRSTNYQANNFGCAPSASPSDAPSLTTFSNHPSFIPTSEPSIQTARPTTLVPSSKPSINAVLSDHPSSTIVQPISKPSHRPTAIMDQIFLVPEKLERSGALQSQVLLAGMDEDEVQVSARVELTPPTGKPSLRPTSAIKTAQPTEPPVILPNNIFKGADIPTSGSLRACIGYPLLSGFILLSLGLFIQLL